MFHIIHLVFIVLNLQNNTNMNSNVRIEHHHVNPADIAIGRKAITSCPKEVTTFGAAFECSSTEAVAVWEPWFSILTPRQYQS